LSKLPQNIAKGVLKYATEINCKDNQDKKETHTDEVKGGGVAIRALLVRILSREWKDNIGIHRQGAPERVRTPNQQEIQKAWLQKLHLAKAQGIMEAIEGIQYPYALDKSGSIVKAVDTPRSELYTCISCGERMVLRRGEIKRPYFAHYTEDLNCTPETVIHKMAKDNIKTGIDRALKWKFKYQFTWRCPVCNQDHKGDLALSPREVKTEVSLDGVRPDILLSSIKGKPLVAVEVVVTHSPEQEAIEAYKRLKMPVLLIRPGWEDLEKLKTGLGQVKAWKARCRAKRCPKCKSILRHTKISSVNTRHCWKCGKLVRVLWPGGFNPYDSRERSKSMIGPASMVGVKLRMRKAKTDRRQYAFHECPYCGKPQGDTYIYTDWFNEEMINNTKPDRIVEFYYCDRCDTWLEKKRAANSMTALQTLNPSDREKGA